MKQKILLQTQAIVFSLSLLIGSAPGVLAQEMPAEAVAARAQAQANAGPSAAELAAFESEFGAPPSSFADNIGPGPAAYEETGTVPDFVKQYASDAELVKIYCAMVRWKSGDFFSAMDAVNEYLTPPMEKVKALGINIDLPDTAALKAEGEKKIASICSAATLSEAEKQTADFRAWGLSSADSFSKVRELVQAQTKVKGDELRTKINTDLLPFVNDEKAKLEAEIETEVDRIVEQKKAQIQSEAQANMAMGASGFEARRQQIVDEISAAIDAKVKVKTVELESRITTKVEEIVGPEKQKFEDIGKAFSSVGTNIDSKIKSRQSEYLKYRDEAFDLRMELVLKIMDKSIADGLAQLDAAKDQINDAKKEDPTIKSADTVRAEIQADRAATVTKLRAALEAGDENAFQQALNDFRQRWEDYRTEMQKVALAGMSKACDQAKAQFGPAKTQMADGASKIRSLMAKCSDSTTDECLSVNEFAGRFSTILDKFDAMGSEIGMAEKMCENVSPNDREQLMAIFKKIQGDAEDLKVFGQALEADKQKAIADSATKVCRNVLAKIQAVVSEVDSTDLPVFENNIKKCKGKNTPECDTIRSLEGHTNEVMKGFKEFTDNYGKVRGLCANVKDENDIQAISVILNSLKDKGDDLKIKSKNLKVQLSEQASAKAFCRAVVPALGNAKTQVTNGLKELAVMENSCKTNKSVACNNISVINDKIAALRNRSTEVNGKIKSIESGCKDPNPVNPPGESLIDAADYVRSQEAELKKMAEDVKTAFAALGVGGKGVWIEAESAVNFNSRLGVSNPMAREVNPSWRPPYSGSGTWYMGAGGDYLEYNIAVPADGRYSVWVRDYVDNFQQRGIRRIKIFFDGTQYGIFGETGAAIPAGKNATIAWHQVGGSVYLKIGSHTMKIVKESSTAGAAILDAFYLTTGAEAPTQ